MATRKVEKTGVYRDKNGNAVYLVEGAMVDETVLANAELDAAASKDYVSAPEPDYFGRIVDAPQDQKAEDTWSGRNAGPSPENRMEQPAENRSDAEMAAAAAKAKK